MFENEDGVTRQYGVKMNKFGKIMEMTKPQILRLIIDVNERVSNFDDEIKEVSFNYSMLEEQIKAFNKKFVKGRADNQVFVETEVKAKIEN